MRSLDDDRQLMLGNLSLSETAIILEDFIRLPASDILENFSKIIVLENEMVYLTFPKMPETLCVWGHGFSVTMLKSCDWFKNFDIMYFGDLDEHGFQILSDFRAIFPQTRSLCMDMNTLIKFDKFRCEGKILKGNSIPAHLTEEELAVFKELRRNSGRNRLEQERISLEYIKQKL